MYCKRCNANLIDSATVCSRCGSTEFTATPPSDPTPMAASVPFAGQAPAPSAPWASPVASNAYGQPSASLPAKKAKGKLWNWLGFLLGVVTIIAGVVFLLYEPEFYETGTPSYSSFGADFYTYQYRATRTAAANISSAVATLRGIESILLKLGGLSFMVAGALIVIRFGKRCFSDKEA